MASNNSAEEVEGKVQEYKHPISRALGGKNTNGNRGENNSTDENGEKLGHTPPMPKNIPRYEDMTRAQLIAELYRRDAERANKKYDDQEFVPCLPSSPLPMEAPEMFVNRPDKDENIIEFLIRVWRPWVEVDVPTRKYMCKHEMIETHILTRAKLRAFDRNADAAIEQWLNKKKPIPSDIWLPTKPQLNSMILEINPGMVARSPKLARVVLSREEKQAKLAKLHMA